MHSTREKKKKGLSEWKAKPKPEGFLNKGPNHNPEQAAGLLVANAIIDT